MGARPRAICLGPSPGETNTKSAPVLVLLTRPYPRVTLRVTQLRRALLMATSSSVNQYINSRPCRSGSCLTAPSLSATGREVLMTPLAAEEEQLQVPCC